MSSPSLYYPPDPDGITYPDANKWYHMAGSYDPLQTLTALQADSDGSRDVVFTEEGSKWQITNATTDYFMLRPEGSPDLCLNMSSVLSNTPVLSSCADLSKIYDNDDKTGVWGLFWTQIKDSENSTTSEGTGWSLYDVNSQAYDYKAWLGYDEEDEIGLKNKLWFFTENDDIDDAAYSTIPGISASTASTSTKSVSKTSTHATSAPTTSAPKTSAPVTSPTTAGQTSTPKPAGNSAAGSSYKIGTAHVVISSLCAVSFLLGAML